MADQATDIVNTHDQLVAAGGGVAIMRAFSQGRGTYGTGFLVYRLRPDGKEVQTDPSAHWSHHGRKVFSFSFGRRTPEVVRATLEEAQAWVAAQGWYAGPWARNRMGDWLPASIHKQFPLRPRRRAAPTS